MSFVKNLGMNQWNFKSEIKESDVVIFSTSSKNTLLTKSDLTNITLKRDKKLLLVDLSVPRNLSSDLYDLDNIEIINVDNLKDAVNENYKKRKGEIIKAELYIEEFLVEFDDWTNSRLLRPSILSLKKQVRELIVNETLNNIEDYYSEERNGEELNSHLNKVYDKFSSNLVKKIKKASNNGKDEKAIEVINQIFLNEK